MTGYQSIMEPTLRRVEQKISPAGFAHLHSELQRAELEGHDPTTCAAIALTSVGLGPSKWPPEPVETVLVVDYSLDGPVYPFMEWPSDWPR